MTGQLVDWGSRQLFNAVHRNKLIYNACWEDPRLDRQALQLKDDDTVLMITSAGCNALDYLLDSPRHIYTVDLNPRQNALLDLKLAGIRELDFDDFFMIFGEGRHPNFKTLYRRKLRPHLKPQSQAIWDRHEDYFTGNERIESFYYRGAAGAFAKGVSHYIDYSKLRPTIEWVFSVDDVRKQWDIYHRYLKDYFWKPMVRWALRWDASLALLGVPRPQKKQVERNYAGGIAKFMEDCVEAVFTKLPLGDNYFWWLYFQGEYTRERCPEYLKKANFERYQNEGLVDRVSTHTSSITDFLEKHRAPVSRYVLLDHMDWLSGSLKPILEKEWQAISDTAEAGSRLLWRSGGWNVDFVDPIQVNRKGRKQRVGDLLEYNRPLAAELHAKDRVHTYGSYYIADMVG